MEHLHKDEKDLMLSIAMHELYPEYYETEDPEIRKDIASQFFDYVYMEGLKSICDTVLMMRDLAKKKEARE